MLRRKATERLERWKDMTGKALLVTGARQIGKSYAIREFGMRSYACYVEVNLLLDRDSADILTAARSASDFINRVALLSPNPLVEGDTLIFIDEVQEFPDIVTLAKALVEDGRYSFAFSGSMLGTELRGIRSFPVGYVHHLVMRPLDFEEFSWAVGIEPRFLDEVRACLIERRPVDAALHDVMLKNYRAYIIVGGMPEVVQNYIDAKYTLAQTRAIQAQLVSQYAQDISKYAGRRALEVRSIFDRIPVQLETESHRFFVSTLDDGARYSQYDQDFLWLVSAGVGLMVSQVTEAKSPLKRTESAGKFKLYESDTGMLLSRYPQSTARAVYLDQKTPNLGGIYENVVAQELAAQGIGQWYFQSDAVGEVDFLIEGKAGHVVPIEVKSGRKVRAHAALDKLLEVGEYKIQEAVVLSRNNLSREGKVLYLPIYMTFCLDELTELATDSDTDFVLAPALPK